MCGIAGTIGGTAADVDAMLDRIQHRGPDGRGLHDHGGTIHGHVRLALVDLTSASAQPFRRSGATLTFNGELWNWKELKKELQALGEMFHTNGDTEVLIAMLNRFGMACLPRLDGMFAFAWSSPNGEHRLVRDSFGKIPIYVSKTKDGYSWASERKAFPKGSQPIAIPPGAAFNLQTGQWMQWYQMPKPDGCSPKRTLDLLRLGVEKRLSADAPVCCLISGGMDSGLILALARELRKDVVAFTATFDKHSEDARSARKLCAEFGIKLFEVQVEPDDAAIHNAMRAIEIPSKAQIEIAVLCLPLAARIYAEGFRACLSGEAADELFGGYGNFCIKAAKESDSGVVRLREYGLGKMARGNFIRCNKAFMAHGVECRLPFMEQALVESTIQLGKKESPPGKKLLKEACRGVIPAWVVNRTKDTFQGGSGVSVSIAGRIASPIKYYNSELRNLFGYLPVN